MPPPAIMEGEGKAISAAEAAAYKKAGVLVKHGFFDAREVAAMQRTVREFKRSELLYDSEPCTSLLCPCPYESVIDASGLRTDNYPGEPDLEEPGPTSHPLQVVRTLVYPAGFAAENDGGLGLVGGGHLYKGHTLSSNGRQGCTGGSDEDLEAGWL